VAAAPRFAGKRYRREIGGYATEILEQGTGSPVLLIHGSSAAVDGWLTWFRLIPELSKTHRVIAYDQPGFGKSQMPADGIALGRLERARHALALVEALDLQDLGIVGHSEGGFAALWLAIQAPARIRKLVIVTSGAASPRLESAEDRAWRAAAAQAYDYAGRTADEATFVATEGNVAAKPDPAFEALLRENYREALSSGNIACMVARQKNAAAYGDYVALQEEHLFPQLDRLPDPPLLLWAGGDPTVPVARGAALAALIPGAVFQVIPGSGHWLMHEAPAAFNAAVTDWLKT